jgi:hypothetical protein
MTNNIAFDGVYGFHAATPLSCLKNDQLEKRMLATSISFYFASTPRRAIACGTFSVVTMLLAVTPLFKTTSTATLLY